MFPIISKIPLYYSGPILLPGARDHRERWKRRKRTPYLSAIIKTAPGSKILFVLNVAIIKTAPGSKILFVLNVWIKIFDSI